MNIKFKILQSVVFVFLLFFVFTGNILPKSLYVLNMSGYLETFDMQGNKLVSKTQQKIENAGSAVAIAIDEASQYMFIAFGNNNNIAIYNAKDMAFIANVKIPGGSRSAGIVVDQTSHRLYVVNREENILYVFQWDRVAKTLTNLISSGKKCIVLNNVSGKTITGTMGLSIDKKRNRLYVGYSSNGVMGYNIDMLIDKNHAGVSAISNISTSPKHDAVDIAIDTENQFMYVTSYKSGPKSLFKYEMKNNNKMTIIDTVNISVGVAVDQKSGMVYVTTAGKGNNLRVYDTAMVLKNSYMDSQRPTGLIVSNK